VTDVVEEQKVEFDEEDEVEVVGEIRSELSCEHEGSPHEAMLEEES
jgi:hypothetical protein